MLNYRYNVTYRLIGKNGSKSMYQQEYDLLHEFYGSTNDNLAFEYPTRYEARKASLSLMRYAKLNRMNISVKVRGEMIIIVRKGDE